MDSLNLFDRSLKVLGRNYPETFLDLALPEHGLKLVGTRENIELSVADRSVDFLHEVRLGEKKYLLHIEFQLQHKSDFPRRMFTYSAQLTDQFQKPVISVVLYLERRKAPLPREYRVKLGNRKIHRFNYHLLKLWDYEEQIERGEIPALAPLLAMVVENPTAETLELERSIILQETDVRKRGDLLAVAVMIARRYFDSDWLWEFFREEVKEMENTKFAAHFERRGLEQGLQQGLQQGEQSLLLKQMEAKFDGISYKIADRVRAITDLQRLEQLGIKLLKANSIDEMGL